MGSRWGCYSACCMHRPQRCTNTLGGSKMRRIWCPVFAFLSLSLLVPLYGQSPNATVSGLITDSAGLYVPEVVIELTDIATGITTTAHTNNQGLYRISNLQPDTYKARVMKKGFATIVRDSIALHVEDAVEMNFTLQVGSEVQNVTVEAGAPMIETQSASLSQVIEGRTVEDTPLNGRNVMNLVALAPGVVAQGTSSGSAAGNQGNGTFTNPNGWGNYQIGGGFANQSATFIDGAPMNTSYVNSMALVETQDAIKEFRVESSNVSPQYGRFAGGVISMTTKSGGNGIHGTVYEYIRNKVLNANYYFNNQNGIARPAFTQNQYGFTASGPIKREKAFFFFSWEGFSLRTGAPQTLSVPTDAMKGTDTSNAGVYDLSALGVDIFNPFTTNSSGVRTQYSCNGTLNAICSNQVDSTAAILLGYFPEPNKAGTSFNYAVDPASGANAKQYNTRIDYVLSPKQRLFGRYTYWHGDNIAVNAFHNTTATPGPVWTTNSLVLGDTYTINNSTVADFRLSYLRFVFNAIPLSEGVDLSKFGSGYASLASQVSFRQNPIASITGYNLGGYTSQDLTILNTSDNYVLSANVIKTVGKHSLTFGGEMRKIEWYYAQDNDGGGFFNFDQAFTSQYPNTSNNYGGAGFASFLAGAVSYSGGGRLVDQNQTAALQPYYGLFVNDSFQVNSKLTVNAGLRWEQPGEFSERKNRVNVLLPDVIDPLSSSTGLSLTGQVPLVNTSAYHPRQERELHWNLFAPRVGMALQVRNGMVIRAGYGLSYLPDDVGFVGAPWESPVNNSSTSMVTSLDAGLTPYATLSNPFPNGLITPIGNNASRLTELEGEAPGAVVPTGTYAKAPYVQQWNLNVQQQIGARSALEIAYAGSKGNHLPLFLQELDQLPDQYDSMGAALFAPVENPFYGNVNSTSYLNLATTLPAGFLLKPHPQFLALLAYDPYIGNSNYHAMQVRFQRQFGAGGVVTASYAWSKLISDTDTLTAWLESSTPGGEYGGQDADNRKADRSLSANDVPQNLTLSYVVDVPVGKGKKLMGDLSGLPNALLGGWSLNGVTNLRSGFPLTFGSAATNYLTSFDSGGIRPNVVAGCNKKISGSAHSRLGEWFNTSCFAAPGVFSFGNETRNDDQLRAQGTDNWDFGVFKKLPIKERYDVQFRAEVFNVANHAQFAPPGTTLGVAGFGAVTGQANQPRLFQFSLRVDY
jgi:hypothetical protein